MDPLVIQNIQIFEVTKYNFPSYWLCPHPLKSGRRICTSLKLVMGLRVCMPTFTAKSNFLNESKDGTHISLWRKWRKIRGGS
jgi:hypothetical protein